MTGERSYDPRRLVRNLLASVVGEGVSKGAAFLAAIVVARSVSASEFGRFSFVLALVGFALLLSDVGLQVAGTRLVAANRERAHAFLGAALAIGIVLSILCYAALGAAALLDLLPSGTARPVAIFATVILLAAVTNAYWSFLRGHERQDLVYLAYAISSLALLAGVIVAAAAGVSLEGILAVYVAAYLLRLVLSVAFTRTEARLTRPRLEPESVRLLLRTAPAIAVAYTLLGVYAHVDVVLLGFLVSAAEVGDYAAAYRLVDAATFLTAGAITTAAFPVFARLAAPDPAGANALYGRLVRLLVFVLAPATLLLLALADPVTELIYGTSLDGAARLLTLLSPSIVLIAVNYLTALYLLAIGMARAAVVWTAAAAVVNVTTNLIAVPAGGVEWAALATFAGEAVLVAGLVAALHQRGFGFGTLAATVAGLALVGIPFGLVELADTPATATYLVGAAVALLLARPLGLVHGGDVASVRRTLSRS